MSADLRQAWLSLVASHVCHREAPADDRFWCPEYDRMPRERLREVQEEKLRLAVHYLYEHSPFYRRKLDAAGIAPSDIRSLDDLPRLPLTTKEEMSLDVAAKPPFGEYTALDDEHWNRHGWMMFTTSGTTAQPRGTTWCRRGPTSRQRSLLPRSSRLSRPGARSARAGHVASRVSRRGQLASHRPGRSSLALPGRHLPPPSSRCCDDPLNPPWLPRSEWKISPGPARLGDENAYCREIDRAADLLAKLFDTSIERPRTPFFDETYFAEEQASALAQLGRPDAVQQIITHALPRARGRFTAWFLLDLAVAYARDGQPDAAAEAARQTIREASKANMRAVLDNLPVLLVELRRYPASLHLRLRQTLALIEIRDRPTDVWFHHGSRSPDLGGRRRASG
jgi:hypothetical protein